MDADTPHQGVNLPRRITLKSLRPGEPPDGELDAGEGDEGGEGVSKVLVVLGQTAVSAEPRKGPFDDPATRQDDKS